MSIKNIASYNLLRVADSLMSDVDNETDLDNVSLEEEIAEEEEFAEEEVDDSNVVDLRDQQKLEDAINLTFSEFLSHMSRQENSRMSQQILNKQNGNSGDGFSGGFSRLRGECAYLLTDLRFAINGFCDLITRGIFKHNIGFKYSYLQYLSDDIKKSLDTNFREGDVIKSDFDSYVGNQIGSLGIEYHFEISNLTNKLRVGYYTWSVGGLLGKGSGSSNIQLSTYFDEFKLPNFFKVKRRFEKCLKKYGYESEVVINGITTFLGEVYPDFINKVTSLIKTHYFELLSTKFKKQVHDKILKKLYSYYYDEYDFDGATDLDFDSDFSFSDDYSSTIDFD